MKPPFIIQCILTIAAACSAVCCGSTKWFHIKREKLFIDKAVPEKPLQVLLVSDLHSRRKDAMHLNIWTEIDRLMETETVDMVLITGDVVVSHPDEIGPHLPALQRLANRRPVFFVDGNHEMTFAKHMAGLMRDVGVRVLYNESVTFRVNGGDVRIVGVRDYYTLQASGMRGVKAAFDHAGKDTEDILTIVLSHQPEIIRNIKKYNPDLIVCGHTHGGQIRIPFLPVLYAPGQGVLPKYGYGWYKEGNTSMFVSKGIGATVFPIRFYNRPEAVLIRICGTMCGNG